MTNVITLPIVTKLDIKAPDMLRAIADDEPKNAFVIAWPGDGTRPTYHSSTADMAVVLMRVQQFIHKFYEGDFTDGDTP
jgi:hypothetical protein